jgi:DNA-binding cell septation regulator SpoVG
MVKKEMTTPKIEVIGIYKEKHMKKIWGTFHVYLIDKDIDIRGGRIFKDKNSFFIQMPQASGTDEETGKRITFPVLSFTDKDYEKAVRYEVIKYVRQALADLKLV